MNRLNLIDGFHLRPYAGADLPRLLAFVGECARAACAPTPLGDVLHCMTNSWRAQHLPEHFHLCEDDAGALVALVMLYPARYGVYDVILHPAWRGGDLERALIAHGETAMHGVMQAANRDAPITSDAAECDSARCEALAQAGYSVPAEPSMFYNTRSLDEPIPASILPDGFVIRSVAGIHEAEALGVVHSGAFGSRWTAEEYRRVMQTPGFHIDRELVVVAPEGRLAAFLVYWVDPISGSGLFEPVGCHPDFQRMGLTKALLCEGMRRMKAHGLATAVVKNLAASAAAAALYASVGFRRQYAIFSYEKPMP